MAGIIDPVLVQYVVKTVTNYFFEGRAEVAFAVTADLGCIFHGNIFRVVVVDKGQCLFDFHDCFQILYRSLFILMLLAKQAINISISTNRRVR